MDNLATKYSSYEDAILDISIYTKLLGKNIYSLDELRKFYFDEFRATHKKPSLLNKRYELSRLVSDDYRIRYIRELELKANESLVNLQQTKPTHKSNLAIPDSAYVSPDIKFTFTYENKDTQTDLESLIARYDIRTGEVIESGVSEITKVVGSTKLDPSLEVEDNEDIEQEVIEQNESIFTIEEPTFSFEEATTDFQYEPESLPEVQLDLDVVDSDTEGVYNASVELQEEESTMEEEYEEEYEDEESEYEEDYDESDEDEEDYDESDEDEIEQDDETSEEYEDEYEDNEPDYEDEVEEDYDEDMEEIEDEGEIEDTEVKAPTETKIIQPEVSYEPEFDDNIEFEPPPSVVTSSSRQEVKQESIPKEKTGVLNKEAEPTDLRAFLRKHNKCELEFLEQYFTKKQINDALKIGKIIKKGNKIRLP